MTKDLKWFKFGGACVDVAEKELHASLNDCSQSEHEQFIDMLYKKYLEAGEPIDVKLWLKEQLCQSFLTVKESPKWVEGQPSWPWLNGKPMVFLDQIAIPDNQVAAAHGSGNTELYVFGARVQTPGGWKMEYRVIDQRADLKRLVALVDSELPPHTPANTKLVKRKSS